MGISNVKRKFLESINGCSMEQLDEMLLVIKFIANATEEETKYLREQMKNEGFNARDWIESKRPLELEVV